MNIHPFLWLQLFFLVWCFLSVGLALLDHRIRYNEFLGLYYFFIEVVRIYSFFLFFSMIIFAHQFFDDLF
jgi:hypothetical protein